MENSNQNTKMKPTKTPFLLTGPPPNKGFRMLQAEGIVHDNNIYMKVSSKAVHKKLSDGEIVPDNSLNIRFQFDIDPVELYGRILIALSGITVLPRTMYPGYIFELEKPNENLKSKKEKWVKNTDDSWVLNCYQVPAKNQKKNKAEQDLVNLINQSLMMQKIADDQQGKKIENNFKNQLRYLKKTITSETEGEEAPKYEFIIERAFASKKNAEKYRFTISKVGLYSILNACAEVFPDIKNLRMFDGIKAVREGSQVIIDTGNVGRFPLSTEQKTKLKITLQRFIESGPNRIPIVDIDGLKAFVLWKKDEINKVTDGLTIQINGSRSTIGYLAAAQLYSYL